MEQIKKRKEEYLSAVETGTESRIRRGGIVIFLLLLSIGAVSQ